MGNPKLLVFALVLATAPALAAESHSAWLAPAGALSSESPKVRSEAIRKLRRIPTLKSDLEKALRSGDHLELACEAAQDLGITELVPALIASEREHPRFELIEAMRGLARPKNVAPIQALVREQSPLVSDSTASLPTRIALIRLMSSQHFLLPDSAVEKLLADPHLEMRSEAIHYAGAIYEATRRHSSLAIFQKGLAIEPYQARLAALEEIQLLAQISPELRPEALRWLERCQGDSNTSVRLRCAAAIAAWKPVTSKPDRK